MIITNLLIIREPSRRFWKGAFDHVFSIRFEQSNLSVSHLIRKAASSSSSFVENEVIPNSHFFPYHTMLSPENVSSGIFPLISTRVSSIHRVSSYRYRVADDSCAMLQQRSILFVCSIDTRTLAILVSVNLDFLAKLAELTGRG
jgi:hypothetical protein